MAEGTLRIGSDPDSDLRVKVVIAAGSLSLRTDAMEIGAGRRGRRRRREAKAARVAVKQESQTGKRDQREAERRDKAQAKQVAAEEKAARVAVKQESLTHKEDQREAERRDKAQAKQAAAEEKAARVAVKQARLTDKKDQREAKRRKRAQVKQAAAAEKALERPPEVEPGDLAGPETAGPKRQKEPKEPRARRQPRPTGRPKGRAPSAKRSKAPRESKHRLRRARAVVGPKVGAFGRRTGASLSKAAIWSRWRVRLAGLWVIDQLRQTDIYLLDRIPIVTDEMRLKPSHQHTYEAKVASASLTRYVCTGCGKLRLTPPETAALSESDIDQQR